MSEAKKRGRPRKERYALLMGGFWKNKKVRRLSLEARGLLATAWSYCAAEMTDGAVPLELLQAWSGKRWPALRKELTAGSGQPGERPFLSIPDGSIDAQANDWLDVNISAAEWEAKLESDKNRKRKTGDFPDGNPNGNPPGNGGGIPATFQRAALDEDEDEEEISRRNPPLETGRAPARGGAVPEVARAVDDDTGIGRYAQLALDEALRADGGALVMRDGDAGHFRTVADAAKACRGKADLRTTLNAWARDFVVEFQHRTAKNFALFAQSRAANGGKRITAHRGKPEDTTPVAGSKPDSALAEARERDAKVARARAEAVPAPVDFTRLLKGGIGRAMP